ncbi:MAG: IS5 family transposase [Acetobacter sp.]|nr:IS5 family transposase [Acetobacter sp.]
MRRYSLRDDQWEQIKDLLPGREGYVGSTAADNLLFVEAMLYRYRVGIPWRDLPARFGDWKNVHRRLRRWCQSDVIERIFRYLAADHDNEYMMIDSTIVRADQAIGRLPGGLTTKIHAICDALGNPVELGITPGQDADLAQVEPLLENIDPDAFRADRAYDADRLIQRGVIPSKRNRTTRRKTVFSLYRERNLIERFFNKLKQFRAIATRYDKLESTFLEAVQFASIIILLN